MTTPERGAYQRDVTLNPRLSSLRIDPGDYGRTRVAPKALSIAVDIDDVVFPWYDRAHAACVAAGITGGVTPTTWSPHEEYEVTNEVWWEALATATLSGTLYSGDPYPGAIEALWRLDAAGHFIHLVTARSTHRLIAPEVAASIREQTVLWVTANHLPHETLTFSKDKTVVPADISVDDNIGNYDALDKAGHYPYLVNRPWNELTDGDQRRRVNSLTDFAAIVLGKDRP